MRPVKIESTTIELKIDWNSFSAYTNAQSPRKGFNFSDVAQKVRAF